MSTNVTAWRDKPPARCVWCLRPAWSETDTCRNCRGIEANLNVPVTEGDALTGGRWVRRGLVLVWDGPRQEEGPARGEARCGTESGYKRHRRNKEATCEECKAYRRDVYHRTKRAAA